MKTRGYLGCIAAIAALGLAAVQTARAAEWALTGALGAHDPTIIKEDALWWCFTTGTGLPVKYSTDGLSWSQGIQIFGSELSWWRTYAPAMGALDVWAPDLHRYNGRTWCFYSVSEFGKNNSAIGLKSCTNVLAGDWRDDGMILSSKSGVDAFNAIDPNLSIDASGNPWLAYGSWFDGIHVVRLDPNTMKPTGTAASIAVRANGIEGANVVYNNGYYYLFVSIDRCCLGVSSTYKIAYGRSANITGPYVDKSGVLMTNGGGTILESSGTRWIGPGGQSVYQNGSNWVIVRHAYDGQNNGAPTLRICDLYFDSDGWPTYTAPAVSPAPAITSDPVSQTVAPGSAVTFSVTATGSNLSYAWTKNGTPIAGASSSTLTLTNVQSPDSGNYSVTVSSGTAQTSSAVAVLLVDTPKPGRLSNLSVRSTAGTGSQTLIAGFIVSGSGTTPILVRGSGPTLANFGVGGVLADPILDLYDGTPTLIAENDSWAAAPNVDLIKSLNGQVIGPYSFDQKDTILLTSLGQGGFTAQVKGANNGTGVALIEVFDENPAAPGEPTFAAAPRLSNLSARSQVGTGDNVLIAGFIINGNVPRRIMIRATGPTLANFGVGGILADPFLELHSSTAIIAQNDNWQTAPNVAAIQAVAGDKLGSYTLDSKDAVVMVTLVPGAYTAVVRGVNNTTGVALIEVFDL